MNIDEMEGRALDVKIAELMGWCDIVDYERVTTHDGEKVSRTFGKVGFRPGRDKTRRVSIPGFSTNEAAAFQVVEKMQRDGWWPEMFSTGANDTWRVCWVPSERNGAEYTGWGSTIQLAICRAALKAVEGD